MFASDLDGTLLNPAHVSDPIIRHAVHSAARSGRKIAIATGRSPHSVAQIGFNGIPYFVVAGNGAFIGTSKGKLLKDSPLDPAIVQKLLQAFPQVPISCLTYTNTLVHGTYEQAASIYVRPQGIFGPLILRQMKAAVASGDYIFDLSDGQITAERICKMNFRVNDGGLRREVEAFITEHSRQLENASFDGDLFELTKAGTNKATAIAWLAQHLNIAEDEVAVYGDGGNDLAMLRYFEHSFAPSNGSAAARTTAHTVIGSSSLWSVPRHMLRTIRREGAVR